MLRLIGNIIVFCLLVTTAKDIRVLAKAWIRQLIAYLSPEAFRQRQIQRRIDRLVESTEPDSNSKEKEN